MAMENPIPNAKNDRIVIPARAPFDTDRRSHPGCPEPQDNAECWLHFRE